MDAQAGLSLQAVEPCAQVLLLFIFLISTLLVESLSHVKLIIYIHKQGKCITSSM